jgi:hypothetical protein
MMGGGGIGGGIKSVSGPAPCRALADDEALNRLSRPIFSVV